MPLQVVDRRERQSSRPRERLRRGDADEQCADEPGAGRHSDELHIVERRLSFGERRAHDRHDELEMTPRRDLGDDAAVARVQVRLRGNDARADRAFLRDHRGGGFVAGRLDSEDHVGARAGSGSRHMISASSRLSV